MTSRMWQITYIDKEIHLPLFIQMRSSVINKDFNIVSFKLRSMNVFYIEIYCIHGFYRHSLSIYSLANSILRSSYYSPTNLFFYFFFYFSSSPPFFLSHLHLLLFPLFRFFISPFITPPKKPFLFLLFFLLSLLLLLLVK